MGISKILPTFSLDLGIVKKLITSFFLMQGVKKTWEFKKKNVNHFRYKKWEFTIFNIFSCKELEIPNFLKSYFLKDKTQAWEFQKKIY